MVKLSKEAKQRLQQLFKGGQFAIRWGFIPLVIYLGHSSEELDGERGDPETLPVKQAGETRQEKGHNLQHQGRSVRNTLTLNSLIDYCGETNKEMAARDKGPKRDQIIFQVLDGNQKSFVPTQLAATDVCFTRNYRSLVCLRNCESSVWLKSRIESSREEAMAQQCSCSMQTIHHPASPTSFSCSVMMPLATTSTCQRSSMLIRRLPGKGLFFGNGDRGQDYKNHGPGVHIMLDSITELGISSTVDKPQALMDSMRQQQ
ncbi:hypothetical protein A6R68_02607 [Neotoma lepida]|uniref:Mitochondrial import receptor subunit TOM7 homolog n=2 Tax=Boreoeutheria TaxID=1437010 RepID=A0A1A6GU45_NEOLE|nr:hypothetical protein A6R68_02607 [Neotoma lepida]